MARKNQSTEYDWVSPISYGAKSMTKVVREVLDELGYKYRRDKGQKPYSKFMIVMPMPKFAYVFKFLVDEPSSFSIHLYDTKPNHSGVMPFMEVHDIDPGNEDNVKEVLRAIHDKLPRPAWKFTLGQKFQYALVSLDYGKSKKAWKRMGFRVDK